MMNTSDSLARARPVLRAFMVAMLAGVLGTGLISAQATPTLPQVVSGQATFVQQGNVFSITNTPNTIINWQSFSVNPGEVTRFIQQSSDSAVLNRILGQDPSQILGALQSNGQVFLINPNGILFGRDARVDVNGLTASTLKLSNEDFLAGKKHFSALGQAAGAIANQGSITTPSGGQVFLIAPQVDNSGIITSPQGQVVLGAGHTVHLVDSANPDLHVVLSAPADQAINLGQIIAHGGQVGIYGALVRQRGHVNANSATLGEGGKIVLKASADVTLDGDSVTSATGAGTGGAISVQGQRVGVFGHARIDASGQGGGGSVLVGGGFRGSNPLIQHAQQTVFGKNASISADATGAGNGGTVVLWSDGSTRAHGRLSALGGAYSGNGGMVETSGAHLDVSALAVDTRGGAGGASGTWLLDPTNVEIVSSGGLFGVGDIDHFLDLGAGTGTTMVDASAISTQLNTTNVLIQATNDITFSAAVTGLAGDLAVEAGGNINVNAPISLSGGNVMLEANSPAYATGSGSVFINSAIDTGGGMFKTIGYDVTFDSAGSLHAGLGNIFIDATHALTVMPGTSIKGASLIDLRTDNLYLSGVIGSLTSMLPDVSIRPNSLARDIDISTIGTDGASLSMAPADLANISASQLSFGELTHNGNINIGSSLALSVPSLRFGTMANISVNDNLSASNALVLKAGDKGTLTVGIGQTVSAGAAMELYGGDIAVAGLLETSNGNITLSGVNQVSNTGAISSNIGAIDLSGAVIANNGTLEASSGAVTINALDSMSNNGLLRSEFGNISMNVGGELHNGVNGNITSDNGWIYLDVVSLINDGDLHAKLNMDIYSLGALSNSASLTTTSGDMFIKAGGLLTNTGNMSSTDGMLQIYGGDVSNHGSIGSSGSSVQISSNGALSNAAGASVATGGGEISFDAVGALSNLGNLSSTLGDIGLRGASVVHDGNITTSEGALSIFSDGAVTLGGAISTDSGSIALHGSTSIAVNSGASVLAKLGTVSISAPVIANHGAVASQGGSVDIYSDGALLIGATGSVTNALPTGSITLFGDQISVDGHVVATSGSMIRVDAVNDLTIGSSGEVKSDEGPMYISGANVTNDGAVLSDTGMVRIGADGAITNGMLGRVETGSGDISLSANSLLNDGIVSSVDGDIFIEVLGEAGSGTISSTNGLVRRLYVAEPEPTLSECLADPSASISCAALLEEALNACITDPSGPDCAAVLPSISSCTADPTLPGCTVVLPTLEQCVLAPSTLGCTVVLPSIATCVAAPSTPGCTVVLPSINVCIADPQAPGCALVLPSLNTCIANPSAPGCAVVLPSLAVCVANPATPGCTVILPTLTQCIVNPLQAGCSIILPTVEQCVLNPTAPGCSVVLPTLAQCIANPGAPGCTVVLPSLSQCVASPSIHGCAVVLPTLAQCVASPSLQGCPVVLPPLSSCVANPQAPGCVVVFPPVQQAQIGTAVKEAAEQTVSKTTAITIIQGGLSKGDADADQQQNDGANIAGISKPEGEKNEKRVKTYCN